MRDGPRPSPSKAQIRAQMMRDDTAVRIDSLQFTTPPQDALGNLTIRTGSTRPTMVLPGVGAGNAGPYYVVVTNGAGSATSRTVTLTVLPEVPEAGRP
jgi:hypothetical protein